MHKKQTTTRTPRTHQHRRKLTKDKCDTPRKSSHRISKTPNIHKGSHKVRNGSARSKQKMRTKRTKESRMCSQENPRTLYPQTFSGGSNKKIGYKSRQKAIETIVNISRRPFHIQRNIINTLFQRAKYHPNQTVGMRKAMVLFKRWLTIAKQKNKK